ncbi:MAG: hypothetical protein LBM98_03930 [Oscillospiraceae bacterium]|nr:hypothetical protein [Oscillospiraceae bacterium]
MGGERNAFAPSPSRRTVIASRAKQSKPSTLVQSPVIIHYQLSIVNCINPRHCEAPVSSRYVGCYRCEAIQCRERNIRYVSQDYYVNPGLLRRISMVRIASAVAASQRRAGLSPALSRRNAPGRWTELRPRTARENHPGASRHPSQEGNFASAFMYNCGRHANPRPNLVLFPSWEGCPRRGGVVSPVPCRAREFRKRSVPPMRVTC